jgi:hypothetical protein
MEFANNPCRNIILLYDKINPKKMINFFIFFKVILNSQKDMDKSKTIQEVEEIMEAHLKVSNPHFIQLKENEAKKFKDYGPPPATAFIRFINDERKKYETRFTDITNIYERRTRITQEIKKTWEMDEKLREEYLEDAKILKEEYRLRKEQLMTKTTHFVNDIPEFKYKCCENNTELCVICQDNFYNDDILKVLECAHKFHNQCINKWLDNNRLCPICKYKICEHNLT